MKTFFEFFYDLRASEKKEQETDKQMIFQLSTKNTPLDLSVRSSSVWFSLFLIYFLLVVINLMNFFELILSFLFFDDLFSLFVTKIEGFGG